MKTTRLAILISGGGTTLQNLAEAIARGQLSAQIVCVIASNPKCFGIQRAQKLTLPTFIVTRKDFPTLELFSNEIAHLLRHHAVDLACMAGFLSLWTIPEDFTCRVLNIHPALLPKFGGKGMHGHHVHEAVLAAHETESGCTVHFADNTYDTGPTILQRKVPVLPTDTPDTLAARVFEQECLAYPAAVELYGKGVLEREGTKAFLRKGLAYITRERNGQRQLLVFDHVHNPQAGTQVPHGTMHHGEDPLAATLREVHEETGLSNSVLHRKIGVFEWCSPDWGILYQRHVYHFIAPPDTPDSWEWYETDGGQIPETPEKLFRFRWHPLTRPLILAGNQHAYIDRELITPS